MTDQNRAAGPSPDPAPGDAGAPETRGGCLNLGWGCLPVVAALAFIPSLGLWLS